MSATPTKTKAGKRPTTSKKPVADPRIEARRLKVARDEGRKRLRLVAALAVITLASIGALVLLQSQWLDIDDIAVVGGEQTSAEEVRAASAIEIGTPLVDLDMAASAVAVQQLPWVASASVTRSWDGTVTIEITERVAVVALPAARGDFMLIDAGGRQLGSVDQRPAWAHIINGLTASGVAGQPAPTEVHGVIRLLSLLTPEQFNGITSVTVSDGNLILDLAQGGVVDLGNDSGLADKLVSYDTIRASVDLRCLHRIDLRVHTAPAITRVLETGETGRALSDMATCT